MYTGKMERQADYPFGLNKASAAVKLYSETFKLPEVLKMLLHM